VARTRVSGLLNRPLELLSQLTVLGRIGEFGGPGAFRTRYCAGESNAWGTKWDGAHHLDELHDRMQAWGIMVRRSDNDALGLPPATRRELSTPVGALDPEVMARYRIAEAATAAEFARKARAAARELGVTPNHARVRAQMTRRGAEHLVRVTELRKLAGEAKRPFLLEWIRQRVADGEKVVVAAHHRPEVDAFSRAFTGLKIVGGQSVEGKERDKRAFQEGPVDEAPVIAVAIAAGGVGHTLTAARLCLLAELPWTPGEVAQMFARVHRIGQTRPVEATVALAEGTIDGRVWELVRAKEQILDAVLDGRQADADGSQADDHPVVAGLAWALTEQGLADGEPHPVPPAAAAVRAAFPRPASPGPAPAATFPAPALPPSPTPPAVGRQR